MKALLRVVLSVWFVGLAAMASAQTLRVTADRTNVRDKASTDGGIVVAVVKGDELGDDRRHPYHVRVKATGSYVNALPLRWSQAAPRPPPPPVPRRRRCTGCPPPAQAPPPPRAGSQEPTALRWG